MEWEILGGMKDPKAFGLKDVTPAVCVRVANTGVMGLKVVRVVGKGLKVAAFSAGCGRLVRVGSKGLTEAFCL
jgi:hypothetical protein